MTRLTIINVAFPFAPVDDDPVGGAEQVVAQLDRALVAAGQRSYVVALAGSRVAGRLVPIADAGDLSDPDAWARTHAAVRAALAALLARERVDVVHFHGCDCAAYLPDGGPAQLLTLHMPLHWYPLRRLRERRPRPWLQPVSGLQALAAPADIELPPPIENGVDTGSFPIRRKPGFALMLTRICAEKGVHEAIDACRRASFPLLVAGAVFPWPEHRRYFRESVLPRLDPWRRWIGPVAGARKRALLAAADCLLVPSRVAETSSLVAMEALAAGTPVVAYPSGALPDVVEHGRTGFIVDSVDAMAQAIADARRLDPEACRHAARERFPLERTIAAYFALYRRLATLRWGDLDSRVARLAS